MTYWRLFYHIVWATKHREPLIPSRSALALHEVIAGKAEALGAIVHAVGGVEDHIHLVVSVPPGVALSEFIRQVKGNSSHFANHELGLSSPFRWQPEFGVTSFDVRSLDNVVKYVKNQEQHHLDQTTVPVFEKLSDDDRR